LNPRERRQKLTNVIALGHPRLPRAQSRPSANIGQVRIEVDSLFSRRATARRQMNRRPISQGLMFLSDYSLKSSIA
jgi:hypothetical protein